MTTAAIQGLAMGLPVIATRHSGFPTLVIEGKSGFLVDEGDYEALAERILYLMDHPELLSEFGSFGRKWIEERFNAKILIDKQIEIYRSVIDKVVLSK